MNRNSRLSFTWVSGALLLMLFPGACNIDHTGKAFFEYDTLEYYKIPEDSLSGLFTNEKPDERQQVLEAFVSNNEPDTLGDEDYTRRLTAAGYKKSVMAPEYFDRFNDIFSEVACDDAEYVSCAPVYRDILVFKKKSRISGIVKICFDCGLFHLAGARGDTEKFGHCGEDFGSLESLLPRQ